jgi:hypothetical protein
MIILLYRNLSLDVSALSLTDSQPPASEPQHTEDVKL